MGKLNKQNLKVLNTTTALQIIIANWALRTTTTTNSRVSFIDLYMYLVFPGRISDRDTLICFPTSNFLNEFEEIYKQKIKVLNTTTALQIIIVNWVLTTSTTNCRVSFIDVYLVFPTNFKIVFLPHINTVISLEPYCGTITEPGLPVSIRENAIFFKDNCAFSRSFLTSFHPTRSTILPPELPKQNKTKQNKHWENTEKRQSRSDKENQ